MVERKPVMPKYLRMITQPSEETGIFEAVVFSSV
jgi:hypothetical protein